MNGEKEYNLKTSIEKLGLLIPPIEDAHGNLVDGVHRDKLLPNCKRIRLEHITDPVQLILARMATNLCRRVVPPEEKTQWLQELVKLTSWSPKEIAEKTGMSERWVYKHLPLEQKKPEPKQLASARRALVECSRCLMATREATEYKGQMLCPGCLKELKHKSAKAMSTAVEKPPLKVTVNILKPKETAEQRKAVITPQVSRMEEAVRIALTEKGFYPETDRQFCLLTTMPDFYFAKSNLAVYLDGEKVHRKRQDKDQYLRQLLTKRYDIQVLSLSYSRFNKTELDEILHQILEAITQ